MSTRTNLITGLEQEKRRRVTFKGGNRTSSLYTESEEQAADQEAEDARIAREARAQAEADRLAKKLKRSELNAMKDQFANSSSIAALKAAQAEQIRLLENIIAYQQIDVEEDV